MAENAPSPIDPEAVEAALDVAIRVYEDERERGQSLASKSSTMAGFSGAILALVAQFGRELFQLNLGRFGNALAPFAFLLSVVALAAAASLSLYGALRPRDRYVIDAGELKELGTRSSLQRGKEAIQGSLLTSLGAAFAHDRVLNDLRAKYARHSSAALLLGIIATAVLAAILALREIGL